jgi:hypothetical protein
MVGGVVSKIRIVCVHMPTLSQPMLLATTAPSEELKFRTIVSFGGGQTWSNDSIVGIGKRANGAKSNQGAAKPEWPGSALVRCITPSRCKG